MIGGKHQRPKTGGLVQRWGVGMAAVLPLLVGTLVADAQEARPAISDFDTRAVIDRTTRPEALKRKVLKRPDVKRDQPLRVRPDMSTRIRDSAQKPTLPSRWCVWYVPGGIPDMGLCAVSFRVPVGARCRCGNHAGVVEDPDEPPADR